MKRALFLSLLLISLASVSVAQIDSTAKKDSSNLQANTNAPQTAPSERLNNVKFLLTDFLLLDKTNLMLGYERVISDHLSIGVNFGSASLPKLATLSSDSVVTTNQSNRFGYHTSVELRYYILSENKYPPPHGVYAGVYGTYNSYNKQASWTFQHESGPNDEVVVNTNLAFGLLGVEIGYQFMVFDHVTIDFIAVGAGVGKYNFTAKSTSDIQNEDTKKAIEKAREQIKELFPNVSFFQDIANGISGTGTTSSFGPGLRLLMISVGYNF
jgi:hypothetical protein